MKYTYLIGWSYNDKWYYGVRVANRLNPEDDLWKEYFTSSSEVKKYREHHGEPDVIKVHKVFDSADSARLFESRFLKRVSAKSKPKWLNKHDTHAPPILTGSDNGFFGKKHSDTTKQKWSKKRKGVKPTEETKAKLKGRTPWNAGKKGYFSQEALASIAEKNKGKTPWNKGVSTPDSVRRKQSLAKKGKKIGPIDDSTKEKISIARKGKKWFKSPEGTECVCCFEGQQPNGWIPGMIKTK